MKCLQSAWKQQIQVDLKGADYNDSLLWKTNEGITVKPFYHKDTNIVAPNISKNNWRIAQLIKVTSTSEGNRNALEAISKGA